MKVIFLSSMLLLCGCTASTKVNVGKANLERYAVEHNLLREIAVSMLQEQTGLSRPAAENYLSSKTDLLYQEYRLSTDELLARRNNKMETAERLLLFARVDLEIAKLIRGEPYEPKLGF